MAAAAPAPRGRCPTCGAPSDPGFRPFCSKRCADVDLHRWFSGSYAIPAARSGDDGEDDDRLRDASPDAADGFPPRGRRGGADEATD